MTDETKSDPKVKYKCRMVFIVKETIVVEATDLEDAFNAAIKKGRAWAEQAMPHLAWAIETYDYLTPMA